MIKRFWLFLLPLALLISSCQGQSFIPTESTQAAVSPATATPPASPTVLSKTDTPGATVLPASPVATADKVERMSCTVFSAVPTPGPTEQSLFPAVSDADWTQGPADAAVTFLEYGDFQ